MLRVFASWIDLWTILLFLIRVPIIGGTITVFINPSLLHLNVFFGPTSSEHPPAEYGLEKPYLALYMLISTSAGLL